MILEVVYLKELVDPSNKKNRLMVTMRYKKKVKSFSITENHVDTDGLHLSMDYVIEMKVRNDYAKRRF